MSTFGGADLVAQDDEGNVVPNMPLTLWTGETGGVQVTTVRKRTDNTVWPDGIVVSDEDGRWDWVTDEDYLGLWAATPGTTRRWWVISHEAVGQAGVQFDSEQNLSDGQKAMARQNIGAASIEEGADDPDDETLNDKIDALTGRVDQLRDRLNTFLTANGNLIPAPGSKHGQYSPDGTLYMFEVSDAGVISTGEPAPGGEPTEPPPPDNANLVTISGSSYALSGTNVARDVSQLIRYTRSATQTAVPTNNYGVDVLVDSDTNEVYAIYNRLSTGGAPPEIPEGSYALSGHGIGSGYAGQFLLDHAPVGAVVVLSAGTPPPDPEPEPTTNGLPSIVCGDWHHAWQGDRIDTYPTDVKAIFNHYVLGLAQSAQNNTGKLGYNNRFPGTQLKDAITAVKATGANVVMGFGGSDDGGIAITNNTQADQAYDSFVGFVNTYGITGIDIDLEPSGSSWSQSALVYLCARLKQTYGPKFIIGVTPGLYGEHTARWMNLAKALGNNMDYMAPMLYDFPEAGDSRLPGVARDKCDIMAAAGIPASKMILLVGVGYTPGNYPATTAALAKQAWDLCKARYPGLRGMLNWEDWKDELNGWAFPRQVGTYIKP